MKIELEELELIRARYRKRDSREDEIITHLFEVEIKRRKRAGAKPKPTLLSAKERNRIAAKEYRNRRKEKAILKKALANDRKRQKKIETAFGHLISSSLFQ